MMIYELLLLLIWAIVRQIPRWGLQQQWVAAVPVLAGGDIALWWVLPPQWNSLFFRPTCLAIALLFAVSHRAFCLEWRLARFLSE